MIWLIAAVVILIGIYIVLPEYDKVAIIPITFIGGFLVFIANLFAFSIGTGTVTRSYPLVSLSDNSNLSGTFFLGSGTIDSHPEYSFYVNYPQGIQLENVSTYDSYIHLDNTAPHVVQSFRKCDNLWWCLIKGKGSHPYQYDFYVPQGSITNKFILDAH